MNKKIKIIELLNKIANGEDLPRKIQYGYDKHNCCAIWLLNPSLKDYFCNERDTGDNQLFRDYIGDITVVLENKVEILEDNTEEIEELLTIEDYECDKTDIRLNRDKINELVKAVNELRKDLNKEQCCCCGVEITDENRALHNMCNECKYGIDWEEKSK